MAKGLFISIEGTDGCGKTTTILEIQKKLNAKGIFPLFTREPGGSKIAEQIRNVILDNANTEEDIKTEALLFAASRRQHLVDVVIPALNEGKLVIADRYVDSSLAYQGYARGIGIEEVLKINKFAIDDLFPDVTFFLDLSVEDSQKRMKGRNRGEDRLDCEKLDFHKKVYEGYKIVNDMFKERIIKIDANRTPNEISNEIVDLILKKIVING